MITDIIVLLRMKFELVQSESPVVCDHEVGEKQLVAQGPHVAKKSSAPTR